MNDTPQTFRTLGHSVFRAVVILAAVLILLWIVLSGLVAVAGNPYLVAVYWFLGLGGLVACAGACTNVFPVEEEEQKLPHPFRALASLAGAAAVGAIFWSQGHPMVDRSGTAVASLGVVLAMATVLGIGGLLVLSVLLLVRGGPEKEQDSHTGEPGLELVSRPGTELATEGKAA